MKKYLHAIAKYRHYASLWNDLKLLRKTNLFDHQYYLAYHPTLARKKIDPCLHYLVYGGFVGRDPSPNFDSSYYLSHMPGVKKSGVNPLIHYIRDGKSENHFSYDPAGGKHIEFIGLPGSGKTTLYRRLNKHLEQCLGYQPGPQYLWNGMLKDRRIVSQAGGAHRCLVDFIKDNPTFIEKTLAADQIHNYYSSTPTIRDTVVTYFFTICSFYQAVSKDFAKPWSLLDEGFMYYINKYIIDEEGELLSEFSQPILNTMPTVDLVIHMSTDVNLCLSRMKERKAGYPSPYRTLSDKEFLNILMKADNRINTFLCQLQNYEITVIDIDADLTLEQSLRKVIEALQTTE